MAIRDAERPPLVRGDCAGGLRPCPWVRCRHHLIHERLPAKQLLKTDPGRVADIVIDGLGETCALDVAARGPHTLEMTATFIGNVTRERARQIETSAMRKVKRKARHFIDESEVEDASSPSLTERGSLRHSEVDMDIERLRGFLTREGSVSPETTARAFGWTTQKAYWRLQRLVSAGEAQRIGSGVYQPAG